MVVVKVCATNSLIYKLKEGVGICFYFYMISMVFVMNFSEAYNPVMYKNILNCRQTYGCWEWISMMSTYWLNNIVNISRGRVCQLLFCTVSFHLFIVPIHYVCLYFWYLPIWCLDGGTFMSRRTDHRTWTKTCSECRSLTQITDMLPNLLQYPARENRRHPAWAIFMEDDKVCLLAAHFACMNYDANPGYIYSVGCIFFLKKIPT